MAWIKKISGKSFSKFRICYLLVSYLQNMKIKMHKTIIAPVLYGHEIWFLGIRELSQSEHV
jgi:hypothetical protein